MKYSYIYSILYSLYKLLICKDKCCTAALHGFKRCLSAGIEAFLDFVDDDVPYYLTHAEGQEKLWVWDWTQNYNRYLNLIEKNFKTQNPSARDIKRCMRESLWLTTCFVGKRTLCLPCSCRLLTLVTVTVVKVERRPRFSKRWHPWRYCMETNDISLCLTKHFDGRQYAQV